MKFILSKMVQKIIYGLIFILLCCGCKSSLQGKLIEKVDESCANKTISACTIALKDVTNFKWDKMYIFPDWTTIDSITKAIGFSYNGGDVEDDYSRMVFTSGNSVIYEEDFRSFDYTKSTIDFQEVSDSLVHSNSKYLSISDAVFLVVREKVESNISNCFAYRFSLLGK